MKLFTLTLTAICIFTQACAAMGTAPKDPSAPIEATVGAFASPGSPWWKGWQAFKTNTEAASGGDIRVKLLINGEAGGEPATMTYVRRNRLNIGGFTLGGTSAIVPEADIMLVPFFFDSVAEVDFILDEYLFPIFSELFAAKGLYLMQWTEVGWLNMYGVAPIVVPEDAKGRRMRVQSTESAEIFMQSLGAEYLQMEFADVIPSLQTGLIYGGETNLVLYQVTGLSNEASHMTFTRHSYDTGTVVANLKWFKSLPVKRQKILEQSLLPTAGIRKSVRDMARGLRASLRKLNVNEHQLTPDQRALWKAATQDNHKEIIRRVGGRGQDVYDAMVAGKKAFARQAASR